MKKLKKWWRIRQLRRKVNGRIKQLRRKGNERNFAETVEYYRLTNSPKTIRRYSSIVDK